MSAALYGILWLSFGLGHSLLTLPAVQQRLVPFFGRTYRLAYNLFATVHVLAVLLIGRVILENARFVILSSLYAKVLLIGMTLAGAVVMLLALRQYDLGFFSGMKQLKQNTEASPDVNVPSNQRIAAPDNDEATEPLNTSGLNSRVRHPLYTGAFLFLWGNAYSVFGLYTAIFASLYFIIGSRHEERKLIRVYGAEYLNYKQQVPAFIPWR